MKNMIIFMNKLKWAIVAKFFSLSLSDEDNPMISGRFISIEPNENSKGATILIRLEDDTIEVSSDKKNDLERLKYKPGDMVHLPCIEV